MDIALHNEVIGIAGTSAGSGALHIDLVRVVSFAQETLRFFLSFEAVAISASSQNHILRFFLVQEFILRLFHFVPLQLLLAFLRVYVLSLGSGTKLRCLQLLRDSGRVVIIARRLAVWDQHLVKLCH